MRGRGLEFGMDRQARDQGRSGRAADPGRARRQARLLRPARPAVHHRARRDRLRRHQTADPHGRHHGQRHDRGRHGHGEAAGAGHGPEAQAQQRARPCRRTRSCRGSCSAPRWPRSRRCRGCGWRRRSSDLQGGGVVTGTLTKLRRAVGLDTIDVESTETTNAEGETTQQTNARVGKYITDKVYLEVEAGSPRHQQGARQGGPHPESLRRQLRHRSVADRRRHPMALRLLGRWAALGLPAAGAGDRLQAAVIGR